MLQSENSTLRLIEHAITSLSTGAEAQKPLQAPRAIWVGERNRPCHQRELAGLSFRRFSPVSLAKCALPILLAACPVFGQSSIPTSDPQALSIAAQTISKMIGPKAILDVTLVGDVTWFVGDPETGTATLEALGTGESRLDLELSNGKRSEIRDSSTGSPVGEWMAKDGTTGEIASQNMATDPVWFFPALSSLAGGTNIVLSYAGEETLNGEAVQHIRSFRYGASQSPPGMPTAQELSSVDFYLDATTGLPVATVFNEHPDNNAAADIAVEIDFSNYQSINGILLPMHVVKLRNGSPLIDFTVTNAEFNTGLTLSQFSIN